VHSTYTAVIIWLVWFPAWFVGTSVVACGLFGDRDRMVDAVGDGGKRSLGALHGHDTMGKDDMAVKKATLVADVTASN